MKPYEKNLKLILEQFENSKGYLRCDDVAISDGDFAFLSAKGLIKRLPIGDNKLRVAPTDKGRTYFEDKEEARAAFWKDKLVNFWGGFASGILSTIALGYLAKIVL